MVEKFGEHLAETLVPFFAENVCDPFFESNDGLFAGLDCARPVAVRMRASLRQDDPGWPLTTQKGLDFNVT